MSVYLRLDSEAKVQELDVILPLLFSILIAYIFNSNVFKWSWNFYLILLMFFFCEFFNIHNSMVCGFMIILMYISLARNRDVRQFLKMVNGVNNPISHIHSLFCRCHLKRRVTCHQHIHQHVSCLFTITCTHTHFIKCYVKILSYLTFSWLIFR